MLLLVFVTIYIYRRFSELAITKDENKTKWGLIGCFVYLGVGLGFPFLIGILIGLNYFYIDLEEVGVSFLLSILSYGLGGLCAYLVYRKLKSYPDKSPDIDNFGKPELDRD
jgi:hypothetical protein